MTAQAYANIALLFALCAGATAILQAFSNRIKWSECQ